MHVRRLLLLSTLPALALPSVAIAGAPMCIDTSVTQSLTICPDTPRSSGARSGPPALTLPGIDAARRNTATPSPKATPGYDLDASKRAGRKKIERKKLSLLQREITLVERVSKRQGSQPKVLLRLGQLYFELAQARERTARALDQAIYDACRAKRGRCAGLQRQQKTLFSERDRARAGNVRALARLLTNHPDFARIDEATFALAFGLEQMGQHERARRVYRRLLKDYPGSAHVPYAYLAFAEHYFRLGDMSAAKRFFDKLIELPPERNPLHGFALYKRAWCLYNLDDFAGALRGLAETIEFARSRPEDKSLAPLLSQARRELVLPYSQVGATNKALAFFSRYAASDEEALSLYEQLGELYFDTGEWTKARAVYHGLMAERPESEHLCKWQGRVTQTVISSGSKAAQVREVNRLIDVYQTRVAGSSDAASSGACREDAATTAVTLAVAWHREAVGTDTQPGTNDDKTMAQASELYAKLLDSFPKLDEVAFSQLDPRDRPTRYRLAYYRAELAYQRERFEECGPAFDAVLEVDARGELTEDAAYGAVLCYDRVYQAHYKPMEGKALDQPDSAAKLAPRELDGLERAMLAAFERYLCYAPEGAEARRIQYRRARIYYEANRFDQAAALFKAVALGDGEDDDGLGVIAANLYLDSLNVLSVRDEQRRDSCHGEIGAALDPLTARHCANDADNALCQVVDNLRCQLARKKAERQQQAGKFAAAARTYVAIARKHRGCGKVDEVLYNAAINFEAAHLIGRAIRVRKVLVDQYQDSPWAKRARYLLGANFHALALYERAAEHYEEFARRHPKELGQSCSAEEKVAMLCPDAVLALSNAIFFRLGLGDEPAAASDATLFERHYRRRDPAAASRVRYALGSIYKRQQDAARIERHFRDFLRDYGAHALPHERIEARLELALALSKLGQHERAQPLLQEILEDFRGIDQELKALSGHSAQEKERFLALARVAAAQAAFESAEHARRAFEAIAFPQLRLRGGDRKRRSADFQRWLDDDFKRWIVRKSEALASARTQFEGVDAYKAPPWSIAAAARVGDMHLQLVDAFRDAPVPPQLRADEELVGIYQQALDEASAPWVEQAKAAYRFCLETATRVRWFNDHLAHCEAQLFSLDPRTYPRAAELRLANPLQHTALAKPTPHNRSPQ